MNTNNRRNSSRPFNSNSKYSRLISKCHRSPSRHSLNLKWHRCHSNNNLRYKDTQDTTIRLADLGIKIRITNIGNLNRKITMTTKGKCRCHSHLLSPRSPNQHSQPQYNIRIHTCKLSLKNKGSFLLDHRIRANYRCMVSTGNNSIRKCLTNKTMARLLMLIPNHPLWTCRALITWEPCQWVLVTTLTLKISHNNNTAKCKCSNRTISKVSTQWVVGCKPLVGTLSHTDSLKLCLSTIKWVRIPWCPSLTLKANNTQEWAEEENATWRLTLCKTTMDRITCSKSNSQRANFWRTLETRSKMERRLKSKTSKVMSLNAPWINTGQDSSNKNTMWQLLKKRISSSQKSSQRLTTWWMMCSATMLSRNSSSTELISKEQPWLNSSSVTFWSSPSPCMGAE